MLGSTLDGHDSVEGTTDHAATEGLAFSMEPSAALRSAIARSFMGTDWSQTYHEERLLGRLVPGGESDGQRAGRRDEDGDPEDFDSAPRLRTWGGATFERMLRDRCFGFRSPLVARRFRKPRKWAELTHISGR